MTAGSPKEVYIVSHTHWDREWYRPFHHFRVDLVDVVQQVLDRLENDEAFEHFVLDGQAIVLEDYLEIRPDDESRLRAQVQAGALSIGPWYVLSDEFLVSAEATVRNLLLGHKVARAFGSVQRVGYVPDAFGHIAQLPQILRLAGMDSFVYTRGNGGEIDELGLEYQWSAPDGSDVLAVNQFRGYCNGGELGFHEPWHARTQRRVDVGYAVEQVRRLLEGMGRRSRGDVFLLNNGCDHLPPQPQLAEILAALRNAFPTTAFKHTGLAEFVQAVRDAGIATGTYSGELLGARLQWILSGVWSTRTYLKQHNERAQHLLANYVEPLSSYAHFALGRSYPGGTIEQSWKLLLQNHPHDSICGCSVDSVHREMVPRFDGVIQSGEQVVRRELTVMAPPVTREPDGDDRTVIIVFNPLPEVRTEVVQRIVVLPGFVGDVETLRLLDEAGNHVPLEVVGARFVKRAWGFDFAGELFGDRQLDALATHFEASSGAPPGPDVDCLVTIQFVASDLPGVGHANFVLEDGQTGGDPMPIALVSVTGSDMENEFCRVRVHGNGTFDLYDKITNTDYPGLNLLEDTEDVGDEYDYSPCKNSLTVTSAAVEGGVRIVEDTGLRAALEASFSLRLPAEIEADRATRSPVTTDCSVRIRVGLAFNSSSVEVDLFFDNRAKDHRLRAMFPTPIRTETIVSDGHFYQNHRPVDQPRPADWLQSPTGTYPQQEFSLVQDGARGLAVINRGLPEIAPFRTESGGTGMALTLLRGVGWLSRDDFPTRGYTRVGPQLATPDAQCRGRHHFRYAIAPFSGDYIDADVQGASQRYRTPPPVIQGVVDGCISGSGLFRKESHRTRVSAIKKHDTRDTLVVRLYNLTAEPVVESLHLGRRVLAAWSTDLLEERRGDLDAQSERVEVSLRAFEIVTVEIEFADSV
ncbi:MAG: hypothetical protein IH798_00315 [Gemmatimonadetes bacterium]|nr:hypothetical protein [Gemmatimonadota bacterium]